MRKTVIKKSSKLEGEITLVRYAIVVSFAFGFISYLLGGDMFLGVKTALSLLVLSVGWAHILSLLLLQLMELNKR